MAAFATAQNMIERYDARTLGDLCSDDGNKVAESALATNLKMTAMLSSATGKIVAACLRAQRYTRAELDTLAAAGTDGSDHLIDVTCQICFWMLWRRKPYTDNQQRVEAQQAAEEYLEMLRNGDHVFDIERTQEAGTPKTDTVTRIEINDQWDMWVDRARSGHFYPARRSHKQR